VECERIINEKKIYKPKTVGAKSFEYVSHIKANGKTYKCSQVLPKYKKMHDGKHKCREALHTCQSTCQACSYYCTKPFGHSGAHSTVHGNMSNCKFMVENNASIEFSEQTTKWEIDCATSIAKEFVENTVRVYTTGDTAEAEICDFFCEKMGRGHFHLIKCDKHENGSCDVMETANNDTYYVRRHANPDECGGNNLDKVTHKYYWERYLKFEDPCKLPSQKQFEKCNHFCPHSDHAQIKDDCGEIKKSYCMERLWHAPVTEQKSDSIDTTVMNGHVFSCSHSGNYHVLRNHIIYVYVYAHIVCILLESKFLNFF
ncbi:hypothetical protein RFI_33903, partial [Reticulomyxa filosa]